MKKLLITSVFALFALALPGMAAPPAAKKTAPAKPAPAAPADPAAPAAPAADPAAPAPDAAKPAAEKPAGKAKAEAPKKKAQGSSGVVVKVDAEKKTITIGKAKPVVYAITDTTEYVNKDTSTKDAPETPAALTDVVEGKTIGFSYTTEKDKRTIVHVNVGVKQPDAGKTKGDKPAEPAKPKAGTDKKKPA